jgi:isopenicillin-N N-acyltransferase like protein
MASVVTAMVECRGDARTRGRAHGEALRRQIANVFERWAEHTAQTTGLRSTEYVERLLADTDFLPAIARHTPELLEEVRGIAEACGMAFDALLAHNLMDEQWWHQERVAARPACSVVAAPAEGKRPAVLAQNMDLPAWMDGSQAVIRHRSADGAETLVLTAAGMVGLTGVNSAGVGVCVNALSMLRHAADGLPVAFAIRGALERTSAAAAAGFLREVGHASGQHYAVAGPDATLGLECSAGGAVESAAGRLCHTNHPLRSSDLDPSADEPAGTDDSRTRQRRLEQADAGALDAEACRALLADRQTPLSVHAGPDRPWLTFGSVVYELSRPVRAWISAGPPDIVRYAEHQFAG